MKIATLIGIFALVGATAVGCSSGSSGGGLGAGGDVPSDNGGNTSSGGQTSNGASSGGSTGANGGSSSGSASSGGTSSGGGPEDASWSRSVSDAGGIITNDDAAATSDPETDFSQTKTLEMQSFTVQPNQEVYYCQNFANPWGKTVDIKTYALNMSPGSHHMFAFYQQNGTDGPLTPCSGTLFGAFTFTAQIPNLEQTYPATVGATIPRTTGFTVQVHYLNTTAAPLTATVKLTMYVAKPNAVTQHAGVIFLNNTNIKIPPGGGVDSNSFTLPQNVTIMSSMSHMHKEATHFVSTLGGQPLFTTNDPLEPPPQNYSPPLTAAAGTSINWSCTYTNNTNGTLVFGESAQTNVMCISVSLFYPVTDVNNPVIATQNGFGGGLVGGPGH